MKNYVIVPQESHRLDMSAAETAAKLALDAEQSAVAARESEIADLTMALALRAADLSAATGIITLSKRVQ